MSKLQHGHCVRNGGKPRKHSPEYRTWAAMKTRVLNPRQSRFGDYGGRGIFICARWTVGEDGLSGFQCFLKDVGLKPSPSHSIDRLNNDDGYYPANVRWATRREQARNTRASRIVDFCDGPMVLAFAVERYAVVSATTVAMRLHRGWRVDDALFTPVKAQPGSWYRDPCQPVSKEMGGF